MVAKAPSYDCSALPPHAPHEQDSRPTPTSVASAPTMLSLSETIQRIAKLDSTVLITGESGVGKGVVARMIHAQSRRANGPFVTTSCPAIPSDLLESEMFGHERGAFTGAHQRRIGRVEAAAAGTLFLDEIGDLPLTLQPKLLNVLQDRQFQRVGGSYMVRADVRIIAATNTDLMEKVGAKLFREDLYYRLNVIPIHLPPLRERIADIPMLCRQILDRISDAQGGRRVELSDAALLELERYAWPGNVRQLENVLERAAAFHQGNTILPRDLPVEIRGRSNSGEGCGGDAVNKGVNIGGMPLKRLEQIAILQTLEICGGNKAAAARSLGITEKTIYNKMSRYGMR
jgi:DNA-binding NtrC family response regulator